MTSTLEAGDVSAGYGRRLVLDRVSCRFERGWTAIIGPNGGGKSTLLRVLAGLMVPTSGEVRLDGRALGDFTALERGRRIAWMTQSGDVTGDLDARETVALGRLPHLGLLGIAGPDDEAAIDRAMDETGCAAWGHRRLTEVSGGERQRVLLARALATGATTLLLDEPTTHLDPAHQVAMVRMARRLAETHTVVTVMHDLALAIRADRVLLLDRGTVRVHAAPDDPGLHAAMVDVFGGAIRVGIERGRPVVTADVGE